MYLFFFYIFIVAFMMCTCKRLLPLSREPCPRYLFIRACSFSLYVHLLCIWIYMVLCLSSPVFYSVDLSDLRGLPLMGV